MSFGDRQQRRIRAGNGARERDLRLYAGNAIDRELVQALELAYLVRELGIEQVAHRCIALHPVQRCRLRRSQRTCAPRMPVESALTGELAGRHSMTKSPSQ